MNLEQLEASPSSPRDHGHHLKPVFRSVNGSFRFAFKPPNSHPRCRCLPSFEHIPTSLFLLHQDRSLRSRNFSIFSKTLFQDSSWLFFVLLLVRIVLKGISAKEVFPPSNSYILVYIYIHFSIPFCLFCFFLEKLERGEPLDGFVADRVRNARLSLDTLGKISLQRCW